MIGYLRAMAVIPEKSLSLGSNQDVPVFQLTKQRRALTIKPIRLSRKKLVTFMAWLNYDYVRKQSEVPMLRSALQRRTLPMKSTKLSLMNFDNSWPQYSMYGNLI
jgi:hypothetical protein